MTYSSSVPSRGPRITPQMIIFGALLITVFGVLTYWFVSEWVTKGVRDLGNGYKLVNLQAISTFSFDQQRGTIEQVPPQWRELDGQKVVMYGEIWNPTSAADGRLTFFEVCYSISKCCYTGAPQQQHFVKCTPVQGRELYYYPNRVKVVGTLRVDVKHHPETGAVSQVYAMDVESVEPG